MRLCSLSDREAAPMKSQENGCLNMTLKWYYHIACCHGWGKPHKDPTLDSCITNQQLPREEVLVFFRDEPYEWIPNTMLLAIKIYTYNQY